MGGCRDPATAPTTRRYESNLPRFPTLGLPCTQSLRSHHTSIAQKNTRVRHAFSRSKHENPLAKRLKFACPGGTVEVVTGGLPAISVVIPARNEERHIATQLTALANQEFDLPWETIVADNGSTDQTREVVRAHAHRLPRLRLVDASLTTGINVARNEGIRAASAPALALCDADDRVRPGWLSALFKGLATSDAVGGGLDASLLNAPNALRLGDRRLSALPVCAGFLPYAPGGNCAFRREVFDSVAGFDESLRGGCDDVDFFWRAQLTGFSLSYVPDAVIDYRVRESLRTTILQTYRYAIHEPYLFRKFSPMGMRRPDYRIVLKNWLWAFLMLPILPFRSEIRIRWIQSVPTLAGRLYGSIIHRVVFL